MILSMTTHKGVDLELDWDWQILVQWLLRNLVKVSM